MHVLTMALFPAVSNGPARASLGVLYRHETSEREGTVRLLLQSRQAPDFSRWAEGVIDPRSEKPNPRTTSLEPLLTALHGRYRFRLLANATRKVDTKTRPDGTKSNGRRVPLRRDDERLAWLERTARAHGFRLATALNGEPIARVLPGGTSFGKGNLTHEGVLFEGALVVEDPARAREAVTMGVGTGKSYGFGLLSLAPFPEE